MAEVAKDTKEPTKDATKAETTEAPKAPVKAAGKGKKGKGGKEEGAEDQPVLPKNMPIGPTNIVGEMFAVVHILSTWNDTYIHATDLTGRQTYSKVTGGMKVKSDREESSPYAAMQAAMDVVARLKAMGVTAVHIKIRARGGMDDKTPGPGAQPALRAIARNGLKIGRIEDSTPIPTDSTKRKGGRRGRRL